MQILLADDESVVRSALRLVIEEDPDLHIAGEVSEFPSLEPAIQTIKPDLLLLDGELPGMQLDRLIPEIRTRWKNMVVIIMSGRVESKWTALKAGADAFICKCDPPERLVATLEYYLCSSIA